MEDIILYASLGVTFVLFVFLKMRMLGQAKLQASVVDALKEIAESMKAGNSFETAIHTVSLQKTACAPFFMKVIAKAQNMDTAEALKSQAAASGDEVLMYVADVLALTLTSKGNVSNAVYSLSQKLWELQHFQKRIDEKASQAIVTLQVLGILIMPALFYFLAGMLSFGELSLVVDFPMQVYLGVVMLLFSCLSYFLYREWKSIAAILPLGISIYVVYIVKVGALITSFITTGG